MITSLHIQNFLKNNIIAEKIYKVDNQAESVRIKNYSYEALEEFISNAVYHKSYQIHEPITIRIEKNLIEITSIPGPDRSIQDEDIKKYNMRTRRYRNRRIGDFLKELHLVEGRNTGIPTALKSIKENGSPLPKLLTDSDRSFFSVILPIHDMFIEKVDIEKSKIRKIRRTKEEIKKLILEILEENDLSASEIYKRMGYTGGISKTFRICINELIEESKICYLNKNKNAPNNLITKR
ncbi:MAG: ATP-binding protein [[Clostridium] innocuum]